MLRVECLYHGGAPAQRQLELPLTQPDLLADVVWETELQHLGPGLHLVPKTGQQLRDLLSQHLLNIVIVEYWSAPVK